MRKVKQGLAAVLAALLMIPTQPVLAGTQPPAQSLVLEEAAESGEKEKKASPGNAQEADEEKGEEKTEKKEQDEVKAEEKAEEKEQDKVKAGEEKKEALKNPEKKTAAEKEEIIFNTGKHEYSVVDRDSFFEDEIGDAIFEEDGSYTIHIPEKDPFFPYEVEFVFEGKRERKWFMTPDDSVEIGGHVFYVSASWEKDAVTQMSLNIGGDKVIVYPEEKEFTDEDDGGIAPASLLPLERKSLVVDLTRYTPVELTMVTVDDLFIGGEMAKGDKVLWTRQGDDYTISASGDKLDLSYNTSAAYAESSGTSWTMIVGKDDQLAAENIRYTVKVKTICSENWFIPSVYVQDSEGKRIKKEMAPPKNNYSTTEYDDQVGAREFCAVLSDRENWEKGEPAYLQMAINDALFAEIQYDHVKLYEGEYHSAAEAAEGTEITDKLFNADMTQKDAGYPVQYNKEYWVTMVAYDAAGNAVGCLPFYIRVRARSQQTNEISWYSLIAKYENTTMDVSNSTNHQNLDGVESLTYTLYKGYAANRIYYQQFGYIHEVEEIPSEVIAAYVGKYASMEEAVKAGAKDIKEELFSSPGYGADYSKGVTFSIFAGENKENIKETYYYRVQTKEGDVPRLSSSTWITFNGLVDAEGKNIRVDRIDADEDSYADQSYLTILVDENADLSKLAPTFLKQSVANLYAVGSKEPEISGKSYHDFSQGPVQYTVSAEDGIALQNIWLQVVKAGVGNGGLYINSLGDKDAKTRVENGVTYSTREMIIDGRYGYRHDIVLINLGDKEVPSISVDLVSDTVELDKYWTLKGEYGLPDINHGETSHSSPWNLAKLRIRPKEGAADGREISGTLTIKSAGKELIVLSLTGTVGDPSITTKEIPEAVKYVPYGTMIQNSNKYSWNKTSYELIDGELPGGMVIRPNGEVYGVPTETGSFTFTVRMKNSYNQFSDSERTFTLTVIENTDANVDGATDQGYRLTQRIQNMTTNSIYEQTMVSDGVYGEFTDIFLDGVKLKKDVDYSSESGSTRITIRKETLQANNTPGRHTLGIEFRTGDTKVLKRAAQNYEINRKSSSNSSGSSGGSGGGGGGGRTSTAVSRTTSSVPRDPKKGYYNAQTGIITGEGDGYSRWVNDEFGWKLIYADGTPAIGQVTQLADGTAAEQVIWEQINGAWYAFGITGYLKSGWVCDYQLNGWYFMTENGMYSGWYADAQDQCVYYMEPGSGKLATGWRMIDGKWYYFNETSAAPTWNYNAVTGVWVYNPIAGNKPYGAAYINEPTPDGYFVGIDGVWDGQEKE